MKHYVTRSEDTPDVGTLRDIFLNATGDVEIEFTTDVNIKAVGCFVFFNNVKSVTINGNGKKVIIDGYGFIFKDIDEVNVNGITFYNFIGDGIQLNNVSRFDVHHNTFVGHVSSSDEAISSVKGAASNLGYIRWNLFSNVNKGILCGTGDKGDEDLDAKQRVYIHHNWFYKFERRAPYCRHGKFYIYNNVFDHWNFKDTQTFCVWVEDNATAYVVDNRFKQDKYNVMDGFPKRQMSWFTKRPWCMDQGVVARLGGQAYVSGNVKTQAWIRIDGEQLDVSLDLPEHSTVYEQDVYEKAGSGLSI